MPNFHCMKEISRRDNAIVFVDTSPSELIHTLSDKILIFSIINYLNIEFDEVKLKQFKDTRTLDRKLKAQDYIIDCFEKGKIVGYGNIVWNSQRIALKNAFVLLTSEKLLAKKAHNLAERIAIAGENLSVGHFLSLAWYALALAGNFSPVAYMAKFERKTKALILLDLLPGDSVDSSRNLNVVRYIIRNTILDGLLEDAVKQNSMDYIAFGYGIKDGSTKILKNQPPLTITDWITQSFYSKLRCEHIIKDEHYEDNMKFSLLANYLLERRQFLIAQPFTLEE
jgi:hypothetical protein